jgi:hypothetical protein
MKRTVLGLAVLVVHVIALAAAIVGVLAAQGFPFLFG